MFTIKGTLRLTGQTATVSWDNGKLSGDPGAVVVCECYAAAWAELGAAVGAPSGPLWTEGYLKQALSAAFFLREMFAFGAEWTGEVPSLGEPAPGSVY